MTNRVILFELNEVPLRIIDRYVAERPNSVLASILQRARVYRTYTEDSIQLDPWISWPTMHRGVTDKDHGVLHLGQSLERQDVEFPPLWTLLADSGIKTGVFGSLHSSAHKDGLDKYAFYLPDYFAGESFSHPEQLDVFQRFNLAMTRQSARNVSRDIAWKEATAFVANAPRLGVTLQTGKRIMRQLADERGNARLRIRRRNLQPLMMADMFLHQHKKTAPDFSTFYSNHVAAAMHRYWAALFPGDYEDLNLGKQWIADYGNEIIAAMDDFDVMLGKFVRYAESAKDITLIVASSLGQAAIPAESTHSFLTFIDFSRFMDMLGVPVAAYEVRPTMVPCLSVSVSDAYMDKVTRALEQLRIDGAAMCRSEKITHPMSYDRRDGNLLHVIVAFDNYAGEMRAQIGNVEYAFEDIGLGNFVHEDGVNCTAQHVPEGSLIIFNPAKPEFGAERPEISTVDFVPSLLAHFGIAKRGYMKGSDAVAFT